MCDTDNKKGLSPRQDSYQAGRSSGMEERLNVAEFIPKHMKLCPSTHMQYLLDLSRSVKLLMRFNKDVKNIGNVCFVKLTSDDGI